MTLQGRHAPPQALLLGMLCYWCITCLHLSTELSNSISPTYASWRGAAAASFAEGQASHAWLKGAVAKLWCAILPHVLSCITQQQLLYVMSVHPSCCCMLKKSWLLAAAAIASSQNSTNKVYVLSLLFTCACVVHACLTVMSC